MEPNPEDYLGMVKRYCNIWARKFPYAADDILSVAYVTLVEACRDWNGAGSIEGYIRQRISWKLPEYLSEDRTIKVPYQTFRRKRKESKDWQAPKVFGGDSIKYITTRESNDSKSKIEVEKLKKYLTPLELEILELRLKGKKLIEIAKAVGLKRHTNVIHYLKKIQEKYKWLKDNS